MKKITLTLTISLIGIANIYADSCSVANKNSFTYSLRNVVDSSQCSNGNQDVYKELSGLKLKGGRSGADALNSVCNRVVEKGSENERSCRSKFYPDIIGANDGQTIDLEGSGINTENFIAGVSDHPQKDRLESLSNHDCRARFLPLARALFGTNKFDDAMADGHTLIQGSCLRLKPNWEENLASEIREANKMVDENLYSEADVVTNEPSVGAEHGCVSLSTTVISPKNESCGNTPACIHVVYCDSSAGQGGGQAVCDAPNGTCPDLNTCIAGSSPNWLGNSQNNTTNVNLNGLRSVINE